MRNQDERQQQVRRVLTLTLVANLVVAAGKIAVGALTSSLAMIADGIHSSLDATSNVIGLIGSALAARPPDSEHPYGHRRFETMASLLIGGVLLLTAWEIVQGAVERLRTPAESEIGAINFIVMGVTIVINIAVSVYERREGKRLRSELLQADADHTRSDVFVSLAVLGGLTATVLGQPWVDAATALVVVVLIGYAAWQITRRAVAILVDRAAMDAESVSAVVKGVPGVQAVERVRSRGPQDAIHLDVDVSVPAPMTTAHADSVSREIGERLRGRFEGLSEVRVRFTTRQADADDYGLLARAEADAIGVGVHEIIAVESATGLKLKMHVEVEPALSVADAHAIVTNFEERMHQAVPEMTEIVTHIEPAHLQDEQPRYDESARGLAAAGQRLAQQMYPAANWHDTRAYAEPDGGYALTMHAHVPPEMPLADAHRMAEMVETRIRAERPIVHRVTIHTEPRGAG